MALKIIKPGMLTTVQDLGRWGLQSHGVPVSGAMDVLSHRAANRIVGNSESAATLEVTILGPEVEFQSPATVAVSGAEFRLMLDSIEVAMNERFDVRAGSRLRFGERRSGARAYIAVDGGIDVPMTLGSRATHVRTGMGGFEGRALRAGDVVKKKGDAEKGSGAFFEQGRKRHPTPFFAQSTPNGAMRPGACTSPPNPLR